MPPSRSVEKGFSSDSLSPVLLSGLIRVRCHSLSAFTRKVGFLIRTRSDIGHTPRKFPRGNELLRRRQPFASSHIKPFYYISSFIILQ